MTFDISVRTCAARRVIFSTFRISPLQFSSSSQAALRTVLVLSPILALPPARPSALGWPPTRAPESASNWFLSSPGGLVRHPQAPCPPRSKKSATASKESHGIAGRQSPRPPAQLPRARRVLLAYPRIPAEQDARRRVAAQSDHFAG